MANSDCPRVHKEFADILAELTREINSKCGSGHNISQVEVSRAIAEHLKSVKLEEIIQGFETKKPNGNRYDITIIAKFPGSGMIDI